VHLFFNVPLAQQPPTSPTGARARVARGESACAFRHRWALPPAPIGSGGQAARPRVAGGEGFVGYTVGTL